VKKKNIIIIVIVVLCIAGFFIVKGLKKNKSAEKFEFEAIKRGNLENVVTCTGTLKAVSTVNVGSQVSGILEKLYVDFNSNVKKGQLLAILDKTLFITSVKDAEAGVLRAKSQYEQAQAELKRNKPLFEKGHLSEVEYLTYKTNADVTTAAFRSAESSLTRARTQLNYTEIRSPIDGTIIERSVDAGQTIAASFQAPKLFIIAEDLTKMQIEASVDESDIGQIKEGLSVRFTVQSYPDEMFTGKVLQIRLSPTMVQNVVNYIVIIDAANDKKMLLPGMTATVDFMIEERTDVLLVSNSAIGFTPTPEFFLKYKDQMTAKFKSMRKEGKGGGTPGGMPGGMPGAMPGAGQRNGGGMMGGKLPEHLAKVYYLDEKGVPSIAIFEKGVTDGKWTEIRRSRDLKEGMKLITSYTSGTDTQNANSAMMFPFGGPGGRRH
jgi:HlyD family secretion protein